jgi:glycosyltransferase involved in cell wall biosynthesis
MLTVAWISPFAPAHTGGGGQIRQAHLLTALAAYADIHLLCAATVDDPEVRRVVATIATPPAAAGWRDDHRLLRRAADVLAVAGSRSPIEVRAFAPARRALRPALAVAVAAADLVVVEYAGLAPLLPARRSIPWVLAFINLPSRMAAHQAVIMPQRRQRWLLRHDARTASAFERRAAARFDAVITTTAADAAALAGIDVLVVPNGTVVDPASLSPVPAPPRLVFTGALYTNPNVDGAVWFCREILPLVRNAVPAAVVEIVGARPTAVVAALATLRGVTVHADVDDISPYLQAARVAVVPIRVGSGSRLKALEALAAGRPVVGTSIGLEGLDLQAGREVLVADDAAAFAAAVVRLLRDDHLASSLAVAGRLAAERFAWPAISEAFARSIVNMAMGNGPAGQG